MLILAPKFFQPLRDLGTFYHTKAQAVGAAVSLVSFLEHDDEAQGAGSELAGPLNFSLPAGQRVAIVAACGVGKRAPCLAY